MRVGYRQATCLEVAVTTKCSVGRACCSALITASFPTPLGPLMMITIGGAGGTCVQLELDSRLEAGLCCCVLPYSSRCAQLPDLLLKLGKTIKAGTGGFLAADYRRHAVADQQLRPSWFARTFPDDTAEAANARPIARPQSLQFTRCIDNADTPHAAAGAVKCVKSTGQRFLTTDIGRVHGLVRA